MQHPHLTTPSFGKYRAAELAKPIASSWRSSTDWDCASPPAYTATPLADRPRPAPHDDEALKDISGPPSGAVKVTMAREAGEALVDPVTSEDPKKEEEEGKKKDKATTAKDGAKDDGIVDGKNKKEKKEELVRLQSRFELAWVVKPFADCPAATNRAKKMRLSRRSSRCSSKG